MPVNQSSTLSLFNREQQTQYFTQRKRVDGDQAKQLYYFCCDTATEHFLPINQSRDLSCIPCITCVVVLAEVLTDGRDAPVADNIGDDRLLRLMAALAHV